MKKNKKIIMFIITIFTIAFMIIIPIISKATIDPNDFQPGNPSQTDVTKIANIVNQLLEQSKLQV